MRRRRFLKAGLYGLGALAAAGIGGIPLIFRKKTGTLAEVTRFTLSMEPVMVEMVDLRPVFMWSFSSPELGPRMPGPVLVVEENRLVDLELTNNLPEPHAFAVPGVVESGAIKPGLTVRFTFEAPPAGTYIYLDPLNAPVNRVMGLNGSMIVMPPAGTNTPYSTPTPLMQRLFDDLGHVPEFPGDPWFHERSWTWHFHTVDPLKNDMVRTLPPGQIMDPAAYTEGYLPQYFMISGKTGYFASHDPDIFPHGNIGMPALIRNINTGLATHSPHIHGNHIYLLATNQKIPENVILLDTWSVFPMTTVDLLHPFKQPPDAHPWPPSNIREFPMPFTMHCHTEMSQTAFGGNYPQGAVTDWEITSPQVGGPEASEEEFPFFRGMDPNIFK